MATVQPIDYEPIYTRVLSEYANSKGILPPELQRLGYGALDKLVRHELADQGLDRYDAGDYEKALRAVIKAVFAKPARVNPTRAGMELADRAEALLTARGVSSKAATSDEYFEALADAKEALDLEARADLLTVVKNKLKDAAAVDVAARAYTLLEDRVFKSRAVLERGA